MITSRRLSPLGGRPLTLLTGLCAALPVIVSTIRAVSGGWLPLGDDTIILVRAHDVLTTHPPLVGQLSASSQVIGEAIYSPGPLLYWLLALPERMGGAAPVIVMGVVNTACVVGIVALARRRGGPVLMFAAAATVAVMCASLDASVFHDVWNPAAGLMPFALATFLMWSLACGDYRLLPLTALVGSFVAQTHLSLALPVAVMTIVVGVFLVRARPRITGGWLLATAAVLLVCWSLPLVEQAIHRPGNVERIVELAADDGPTLGAASGARAVVHTVGVPPWWLRPPRGLRRHADVTETPPWPTVATAVAVVLALLATTALAARRGRRDVAAAGALALALLPCVALVAASTSTEGLLFATVAYTLWWASPAGMFAWLALGWSAAVLSAESRRGRALRLPLAPRVAVAAGVAGVAAIGALVAAGGEPDAFARGYEEADRLAERVREAAPREGTLYIESSDTRTAFELMGAVLYELHRDGRTVASTSLAGLGKRYDPAVTRPDWTIYVAEPGDRDAPRGGRELARVELRGVPADAPPRERARGLVRVLQVRFDRQGRR